MATLLRRWAGPILVAAAGGVMMTATWETWPDPITDFGKEVYIAWQLSSGKRLYLDVAYHLGPLPPYVNALAFRIFGPTLRTLQAVNVLVLIGIAAIFYRLIDRIAGAYAATVAGVTFVTLFAFIHFTTIADYNYVSPYDHAHTHGLLLGLVGLSLAEHHRRTGKMWSLVGAGVAVGLAFLTRAELFVAAAAGVGVVLGTPSGKQVPWDLRKLLVFWGAVTGPIVVAFLMLAAILPAHLAVRGVLGSWPIVLDRSVTSNPFYRDSMGTLDLGASLWRIRKWTMLWGLLLLPAIAAGKIRGGRYFWAGAALVVGAVGAYLIGRSENPADAFAPLPIALIACGIWVWRRAGAERPLAAGLIIWALVLLGKIILNARIYHYGFALAMPATLVVVALAVGWGSLPVKAVVTGALGVTIAAYLNLGFALVSRQVYSMGVGPNQFWARDHGKMLNDCLQVLQRNAAPGDTLAVMPEGTMLNFLAGMANPTPYWSYNPPYSFFAPGQGEAAGENNIAESLEAHPPDWIVFSAADMSDFGTPFFGKDYGRSLHAFAERGYTVVWTEGDRPFSGGGFGVMLLRRNRYNGT